MRTGERLPKRSRIPTQIATLGTYRRRQPSLQTIDEGVKGDTAFAMDLKLTRKIHILAMNLLGS